MIARRRSPQRHQLATPSRRPVDVTIRRAFPDDDAVLARLAALDGRRALAGDVLLAEVAGEPWAALSLDETHVVADPFRPTAELVVLLRARAGQIRATRAASTQPLRRLVPLLGGR